ncbi:MAG: glycosyltransferase family 39 protein, partial [Anaerolineae bacterium]|nr:glycosyltransferase family 39 protein [Anaerolineae bacterium]
MPVASRPALAHPATRLIIVFAVALGFRLALAAFWYTPDFSQFETGDYILYRLGAEHFLQHGDFTNSLFLVRPPLFPLLIAALGVNPLAVVIANCLLGALITPATYELARTAGMTERLALAAGGIMAVEPSGLAYSAFLGPEPLANLLLILALLTILKAVQTTTQKRAIILAAGAGILLVMATYTRPASYLLWAGIGIWMLWAYRHRWLAILIFMGINLAG